MSRANTKRKTELTGASLVYASAEGFDFFNPDPDFVMTYDREGQPLSRFVNNYWSYAAYSPAANGPNNCWFQRPESPKSLEWDALTHQQKTILAAIQLSKFSPWHEHLSAAYMHTANGVLNRLKKRCFESGLNLYEVLSDASVLTKITKGLYAGDLATLRGILTRLSGATIENFGHYFNAGQVIPYLKSPKQEGFQHPVIPSRILFEKLTSIQEVIDDYLRNEEAIVRVNNISLLCHSYLTGYEWHYDVPDTMVKSATNFQRVAIELGLTELTEKYNINSAASLSGFLGLVQYCASLQVMAYSGMRRGEAQSLKYNCLRIKKRPYGRIRHLIGISTKLTRHRFLTSWITCKHVVPAIKASQSICRLAARALYIEDSDLDDLPLFINRSYLNFSTLNSRSEQSIVGDYKVSKLNSIDHDSDLPPIIIQQADLDELKVVAPFQDWDIGGNFAVGQPWPFTLHQLRRSLAVYAAKSGLVRHSSLRRQLKHLSVEMSLYYARGSSRVRSVFNPSPDHIMHDFSKDNLAELDSIMYIRDVLMRHDEVKGGHAKVLHAEGYGAPILITLSDKEKTLSEFKNGRKAWRPTFTGGCTSINGCEMVAHPTLTRCVSGNGCPDAAILPDKIKSVMTQQQKLISVLDVTSLEYRSEIAQLNDLERIYAEVTQ